MQKICFRIAGIYQSEKEKKKETKEKNPNSILL
jgi:hypothetical protein